MSTGAQESQEPGSRPPWSGPWADDARRLFQVLQDVADAGSTGDEPAGPAQGCEHPPECRYCPFCQGVTLLRRAGPDVLDQLSEFAAGLAATLRATQPPANPQAGPQTGAQEAPSSGDPAGSAGESSRVPTGDPFAGSAESASAGGPARPPSTVRINVTD